MPDTLQPDFKDCGLLIAFSLLVVYVTVVLF